MAIHDEDKTTAAMETSLKEKTGRDMESWMAVIKKSGLEKHGQIVKCLKEKHGITHGYANLVAHRTLKSNAAHSSDVDLICAQYAGPKADLKPIYDKLIELVSLFGDDVSIAPKKAYVSLRRKKQFALVQPSTKTRVDLGINLKGEPANGSLEESGSFNSMVSHRVRLESTSDVSKSVSGWLKKAYDAAG